MDEERKAELLYLKQLREREHINDPDCWCFPELAYVDEDGNCFYLHFLPH